MTLKTIISLEQSDVTNGIIEDDVEISEIHELQLEKPINTIELNSVSIRMKSVIRIRIRIRLEISDYPLRTIRIIRIIRRISELSDYFVKPWIDRR